MPAVFDRLLTAKDAEEIDTVLDRVSGEGFRGDSVEKKALSVIGLSGQTGTVQKRRPRSRFRMVLIAACLAVLLVATFAAAKVIKDKRFLELLGAEQGAEKIEDHYKPIGQTGKIGDVTVAAVDMIGDSGNMFVEISTDIPVDQEDGWLKSNVNLTYTLRFEFSADGVSEYGSGPFVRDGKLWYMFKATSHSVDISHIPVELTATGYNHGKKTGTIEFRWTNDYEPKDRTVIIDRQIGEYVIDSVTLNVSELKVQAFGENGTFNWLNLDCITLTDGTRLYYEIPRGDHIYNAGGSYLQETRGEVHGIQAQKKYDLFDGFVKEKGGTPVFVWIEDIASVTVNGVEIPLK